MSNEQENAVTHVTPSGGNVFADLDFGPEEAANLKLRSELMMRLSAFIEEKDLTQAEAADALGTSQPRVSNLLNGSISKFTIDALLNMCTAAGIEVEVRFPKATT